MSKLTYFVLYGYIMCFCSYKYIIYHILHHYIIAHYTPSHTWVNNVTSLHENINCVLNDYNMGFVIHEYIMEYISILHTWVHYIHVYIMIHSVWNSQKIDVGQQGPHLWKVGSPDQKLGALKLSVNANLWYKTVIVGSFRLFSQL